MYRWSTEKIREIVAAQKIIQADHLPQFKKEGERSRTLSAKVDLVGGSVIDLSLYINAGQFDRTDSFRAALTLDGQRIRGVDFVSIERKRYYKIVVPKGWHENVIDPNDLSPNGNMHRVLSDFDPLDLRDFVVKIGRLWCIDLLTKDSEVML